LDDTERITTEALAAYLTESTGDRWVYLPRSGALITDPAAPGLLTARGEPARIRRRAVAVRLGGARSC
jgi:hypothetical protein